MAKDSFWFRHDSNARNDLRIVRLARKYGMEGIGVYWCVVEMLREETTYTISTATIDDIAYTLRVETKIFDEMFDAKLLTKDGDVFYSESLLRRMEAYEEVREKRRKAGAKGGKAKAKSSKAVASAKQTPSKSLASRVEESRVEKKGNDKIKDYTFSAAVGVVIFSYKEHIRELGKSYRKTDNAWILFYKKVERFISEYGEQVTISCIESSIESNWKTIFPPKGDTNKPLERKAPDWDAQ